MVATSLSGRTRMAVLCGSIGLAATLVPAPPINEAPKGNEPTDADRRAIERAEAKRERKRQRRLAQNGGRVDEQA